MIHWVFSGTERFLLQGDRGMHSCSGDLTVPSGETELRASGDRINTQWEGQEVGSHSPGANIGRVACSTGVCETSGAEVQGIHCKPCEH